MEIKRAGTQASAKGPAECFTGTARVDPLFPPQEPARATVTEALEGTVVDRLEKVSHEQCRG